jgi:hypothetical protein
LPGVVVECNAKEPQIGLQCVEIVAKQNEHVFLSCFRFGTRVKEIEDVAEWMADPRYLKVNHFQAKWNGRRFFSDLSMTFIVVFEKHVINPVISVQDASQRTGTFQSVDEDDLW